VLRLFCDDKFQHGCEAICAITQQGNPHKPANSVDETSKTLVNLLCEFGEYSPKVGGGGGLPLLAFTMAKQDYTSIANCRTKKFPRYFEGYLEILVKGKVYLRTGHEGP
jgi:hypothetical protein